MVSREAYYTGVTMKIISQQEVGIKLPQGYGIEQDTIYYTPFFGELWTGKTTTSIRDAVIQIVQHSGASVTTCSVRPGRVEQLSFDFVGLFDERGSRAADGGRDSGA